MSEVRANYRDDVRTGFHAEVLADHLAKMDVSDNGGWPLVNLGPVLPSARDLIVRALREIAPSLPKE
jgi:hypothetical protein